MNKEKIVIIGANDFQNPLILKAKELGYETHVFAWESGDIGEKNADYFYPISIVEKDLILDKCKEIKPVGICSIGSDLANITVNYIANKLNLVCNSEKCIKLSTNKYKQRKVFLNDGIFSINFHIVDENSNLENIKIDYPVIVKPTDRSGSRAITKVEKYEDLQSAVNKSIKHSFESKAIIEEFIEGDEYSVEYVSSNGEHHFLAVTKKFTTGAPNFIETGHIEPSGLSDELIFKVKNTIEKALDCLDIKNGASHSEFKINKNNEVCIIEIGSRMGGDCIGSDLVYLSTGHDFVRYVIDICVGKNLILSSNLKNTKAYIKFIFSEKDIDIYNKLNSLKPNSIVKKSEFKIGGLVEDSSSRFGYYIVVGEDYVS